MELCVLCLDGLEPSLVSPTLGNIALEHTGFTYPPSASSLVAWRKFASDKDRYTWWSDWRQTVVVDLPVKRTHTTENVQSKSRGGLLFDGFPDDRNALKLLGGLKQEVANHCLRLVQAAGDFASAEVLIVYLGISDTAGHVHRTWKPELLQETYAVLDSMAEMIWETCRPKRRLVLSDHGMNPITPTHAGWEQYQLLGEDAYVKQIADGRYVAQTGQHWRIVPGYISSDFLPGSHSLRKLGKILREVL